MYESAAGVKGRIPVSFYEEYNVEIEHLLIDNGRQYCGRPVGHPFELYLAIRQIEHRRTDIGSPETNGFCERSHRTFYAVAFRKTLYESLEQLQRDLDEYLAFYNRERAHQGYRTQGRTPFQTWSEGVEQMRREERLVYNLRHRKPPVSASLQPNTNVGTLLLVACRPLARLE